MKAFSSKWVMPSFWLIWNDYKEYGWNEIEQLKPNDEKFNKNDFRTT
nr:hypothetical protein [Mycoplasmopsis bovis]